ncbi:hypothetical protein AMAG_10912 [Allomyces macrogynus ATCC 38327]|uniref:Expansin-like EG45 domain-containing protein n=1 Tax=Allomyces macrogynus (strain ATCC 38327) TaxID=578462 RepID=A0A0L0SRS9_ALLM3|nr:hypothetical protein AMAG_10912 [Allomyces macrogynus ATCC 38327]|eukprot:KNE65268.1 hypothetical protein AMAG_10912 [Allomyces macrogynus ATCC 38327]
MHATVVLILALAALLASAANANPVLAKRGASYYNFLKSGAGKTTYWTDRPDSWGQCLLDPPANGMAVALATNGLDNWGSNPASMCGACIRIHNGAKSAVARVINKLPDGGRGAGDLDVSSAVWYALTNKAPGELYDVTWEVVDCPDASGPLVYKWKDGSSQWWAGVEIRNHRKPVLSVTVNGQRPTRQMYNYFVANSGFGPGPVTIQTVLSDGTSITDYNIPLRAGAEVRGSRSQ